jgi:hypothetical protein
VTGGAYYTLSWPSRSGVGGNSLVLSALYGLNRPDTLARLAEAVAHDEFFFSIALRPATPGAAPIELSLAQ